MEPYLSDLLEGTGCVLVKSRLTVGTTIYYKNHLIGPNYGNFDNSVARSDGGRMRGNGTSQQLYPSTYYCLKQILHE